jgi:glutamyl-Q tRNA(Asp) synthetase
MNRFPSIPTGRFAPSPSGPLHAGSLVAALGSWLDARAARGRWLLRIEDLDSPRNAPGAVDGIIACLATHGLEWDGPIVWQSERTFHYQENLDWLRQAGLVYPCGCTRREVEDAGGVYPGTCRTGLPEGRPGRAWRVRSPAGTIEFVDRAVGPQREDVRAEVGDFVLQRADGIFAYQLAVVVDDAEHQITDVVRGADLLSSTARQIALQRLLRLPQPRYLHLPLALLPDGRKLSKQNHAPALDPRLASRNLLAALALLGQALPDGLTPDSVDAGAVALPAVGAILDWAIRHWQVVPTPELFIPESAG